MNIRELNERLVKMDRRPVNDTPGVLDPYGNNLWQREDGKWVIASSDDRGGVAYHHGPMKPGGGADIMTFDTADAACDYIWKKATAPRPVVEPSKYTPEEKEVLRKKRIERYEAGLKAATETTERDIRELNEKLVRAGERPINDWPVKASAEGFDPSALSLRQFPGKGWYIMIGDGSDGSDSVQESTRLFATTADACDYIWQEATGSVEK
ncbi:hypothetical protein FHU41_000704 [Psychromicrobium silvestre]|uniref:Uncharacterized protein n=1 Tax=Psychromicrobium silvestre TaxID=1645614 RepID=A0A7Y9LRY7_9MICC|nr:hypothetical protein [Psychromicrobium silvestre]NYE94483.1 hypothetical protein [Psychromicrobium silvestre]